MGEVLAFSGNTEEAITVFKKLQDDYPNDFEIDLNYAEAFMWSKQYETALNLYANLVSRDPKNFPALLGYANAFSENKKYDDALNFVEKALEVSPGNANAEVSQKYMRLGKASILANEGRFEESVHLVDKILDKDPKDIDALMNKGQMLQSAKEYTKGIEVYQILTMIKGKEVDGYLGLSNIANSLKKPEKALEYTNLAVSYADTSTNLKAFLGKVNALGWNKNYDAAFQLLNELKQVYPNNLEVLSGFGRLSIWSKSFAKGANYYKQLLEQKPASFDGNLGYADANHATGMDNHAFDYVRKTLEYYKDQRDALMFLERLHIDHDPGISTQEYWSRDNGGNISTNYKVLASLDPSPISRFFVQYNKRIAQNLNIENTEGKRYAEQIGAGLEYRISRFLKLSGTAFLYSTAAHKTFLPELYSEWKIGRYQIAELKYNEELQTFTAGLIAENIKMGNYTFNYNLSLPSKFGIYSQMIHSRYSDSNVRNLLFASFYYDFKQSPVFKAGFNLSLFGFKNQVPEIYFSPNIFKGYELFAAAENTNEKTAKWIYQLTGAGGVQKISNEGYQPTYRFDLKGGYQFSPRIWVLGYFMRSNSAASSVQGFTYNEWGLKAKYIIPARWL